MPLEKKRMVYKPLKQVAIIPGILGLLLCATTPANAQSPATSAEKKTPPAEFWDYLEAYSDSSGKILDPSDFEDLQVANTEMNASSRMNTPATTPEKKVQK